MIIGFAGKAGSGKSTACKLLKELGYTEINFADPLKAIAAQITDLPLEYCYDQEQKELPRDIKFSKYSLQALLHDHGIYNYSYHTDFYKYSSIRQLLQGVGDIFRSIDPDFWVKLTTTKLDSTKNYCCGDLRYENEANAIREAGGSVILITRPGTNKIDSHSSEQLNLTTDYALTNLDIDIFKRDILAIEGLIVNGQVKRQES